MEKIIILSNEFKTMKTLIIIPLVIICFDDLKAQNKSDSNKIDFNDTLVLSNGIVVIDSFKNGTVYETWIETYTILDRHQNDTIKSEVTNNKLSKIKTWTNYYENGVIQSYGQTTSTSHDKIGKWKYYSETGVIDSIVDYDSEYKISYFKALELMEDRGWQPMQFTWKLWKMKDSVFWSATRWEKITNGVTSKSATIDCNTGEVSDYYLSKKQ